MLTKLLYVAAAFVMSSGMVVFQPGASPTPAPQPSHQTAPATPALKKKEPPTLAAIFKDEAARKAMGLDKLTSEEQQRLADGIVNALTPMIAAQAQRAALGQDAAKKLKRDRWEEIEVVGVVTVKGDKYSLDREVLAVKVFGITNYYGSGFSDELSAFDKVNLRSGPMWGKDMLFSLTLIGLDGTEIELKKVDVELRP